jgi:hypothetical protein
VTTEERLKKLERELARAWLLWLGIVLVGVAAAIAGWVFAAGHAIRGSGWHFHPTAVNMVAVCGFGIAVTGLSGLVCAALGLARLLAGRKGT